MKTILFLLLTLLSCQLLAETPEKQNKKPETVTMNMRNADVIAVIEWMAEQTKKKFIIDPEVKGEVSILANVAMTLEESYEVFLAMLDVHGYHVSNNNGILRIANQQQSKATAASVISAFSADRANELAIYIYQSQFINTDKLQSILKPLVADSTLISALSDNKKLIIVDNYDNIHRLVKLIRAIDEAKLNDIEVVGLQYASSSTMADVVNSLLAKENSEFVIVSDQRSNSLLMAGDNLLKKQVRQLISQLDSDLTRSDNTQVIKLNYSNSEEMLAIVTATAEAMAKENSANQVSQSAVNLSASVSSNALIVTAPPDIMRSIKAIISELDIPRQQVLVEAIIIEVNNDELETLGVEWNTELNAGTGIEAATSFGLKNASNPTGFLSSGLNLGYFSSGTLRGLISMLETVVDVNILSTPSLLTLENEQAEILVGSNVPFVTGQSQTANTNGDIFTTVQRQDIGLTLKVTPTINADNGITLEILQELETLSDSVSSASDLVTNKRSLQTTVHVKNNKILVLGGLISEQQQETVKKVPFLGSIPLLGKLFSHTSTQNLQKNLMIFIHPKIVNDEITEAAREKLNATTRLQHQH